MIAAISTLLVHPLVVAATLANVPNPETGGAAKAAVAPVNVVVVREQAGANAANAQPLVDELVTRLAHVSGWPGAQGRFFGQLSAAKPWIEQNKPSFAIASLEAFLQLHASGKARAIGEVMVTHAGGHRYFVVSTGASDLAACKSKRLVSDHVDNAPFIESVVAQGAFKLSDFTLVPATRPVQTLKMLLRNEADCALIDDAQKATLATLEGGTKVKELWASDELPVLVLAALGADADQTKAVAKNVPKVCSDQGQATCEKAGIAKIEANVSPRLTKVLKRYRPAS